MEQFAQNLRQLITGDGAAAGNGGAATDTADSGASAGQAADAATTQDGPGHTQPSPVVPAAASTPSASAQPPAASADSINLVKLVGPSILKRVVPVAAVAAVLALLGRRLFRRGGKG